MLELASYINEKILNYRKITVDIINSMQIIKRKRSFKKEEKEIIYDIREKDKNLMIQCAIAILLENKSDYEQYFSKLENNDKKCFMDYPIYNLIKKE